MTVRVSATTPAPAATGGGAGTERARPPGTAIAGPAVVPLPESTLVIPEGWRGTVLPDGAIDVRRRTRGRRGGGMSVDPVELQVILGALRATCEEMGAVLIRSAHSANIKERRDASTALFDAAGEMVMQAEHIPVHLGAMPAAVAAVRDEAHAPGRAWVLNDPYRGGTHLPDITVVTPVFAAARRCSASPPAAPTTPTSAARRPARCRPTAARSPTRAS